MQLLIGHGQVPTIMPEASIYMPQIVKKSGFVALLYLPKLNF